jgi:hypothetical protein
MTAARVKGAVACGRESRGANQAGRRDLRPLRRAGGAAAGGAPERRFARGVPAGRRAPAAARRAAPAAGRRARGTRVAGGAGGRVAQEPGAPYPLRRPTRCWRHRRRGAGSRPFRRNRDRGACARTRDGGVRTARRLQGLRQQRLVDRGPARRPQGGDLSRFQRVPTSISRTRSRRGCRARVTVAD